MKEQIINEVKEELDGMFQFTDDYAKDVRKYEKGPTSIKVMGKYILNQLEWVYDTEVKARNKEHVAAVIGLIAEHAFLAGRLSAYKEVGQYEEFLERCAKATEEYNQKILDEYKSQK